MRKVKLEPKTDFDYKSAIDKETQMFEKAEERSKGGLRVRQEQVVQDLEKEYGISLRNKEVNKVSAQKGGVTKTTKKKTTIVPPKVSIKEQEKKAIIMLNELKGLVQTGGRILVFTNPPRAQYCSYNIGGKFCFGVNYSATKFSPYFLVTKAQFETSKIAGKYNGRYCVCSLEKRNITDFKGLTQQAVDNFPIEPKKVVKKAKK